ncbi:g4151 [Coccomyxa elongata]
MPQESSWRPQEAGVHQICYLLAQVQKPGTDQGQILQQLDQCKSYPDFNNYLAFIFAQGDSLPIEVRQSAGLLLKNNLKDHYAATTEEFRKYIKVALLHAIRSPSKPLRHVVGTNVAVIVGVGGMPTWPELLMSIVQCLESNDPNALEGALDALYKICEEAPVQMESEVPSEPAGTSQRPSNVLVPRLLALFGSPYEDAKCLSVSIMNLLAGGSPSALAEHMDRYLAGLFALAHDPSSEVRKPVCTGLVQLLHLQPERLVPHMHEIIEYMLESTQSGDEGVALESCEFWSAFCEAAVSQPETLSPDVLRPFLGRLVPVLLKNMVYDEYDEEVANVEAAEEAASCGIVVEDKDAEIKPFLPKGATRGEEGGEDDDDGEEVNRWNLRKCSAAGLDVLSTVFGDELLPIVLPIVEQRLREEDWRARESAILALGAISEGCVSGLLGHLTEMIGVLLPKLLDTRPLVRSITCWALSRYSHWVVQAGAELTGPGQQQFDTVIAGLLTRVRDNNRHVQEAACSALATLEEAAGGELLPRLPAILKTVAAALAMYGRKNLRILYDAISTLADAVGSALAEPAAMQILMPPLQEKWASIGDTDRDLLPLFECFTSLAQALCAAYEPYAQATFDRCMNILTMQLAARGAAANGQAPQIEPEREFIICSLDLISGLAEGLGPAIEALVARSNLRNMLVQCCQDVSADVRQSAFALVGDLAKVAASHFAPSIGDLLALGIANLQPAMLRQESMSACNNACWSLGEIAVKLKPEELAPFATGIVERLVPILQNMNSMPRSIVENSAITLGRVAWVCPVQLAPHLGHFIAPWCSALRSIRDDVEKEHAFLGLCALLRINPEAALGSWVPLCEAVASWRMIQDEGLRNEINVIMQAFRANLVGQWDQYWAALDLPVREKLGIMCGL